VAWVHAGEVKDAHCILVFYELIFYRVAGGSDSRLGGWWVKARMYVACTQIINATSQETKGGDNMSVAIKKAIPIIVVTWILSLVTTLAIVYFAPNTFPRTWHEVARFSHYFTDYDKNTTNVFNVPSNYWRIEWHASTGSFTASEDRTFAFKLLSEGEEADAFTPTLCTVTPADFDWDSLWSGTEYITGSGSFYIRVTATNVSWIIAIQAYY